MPQLLTAPAIAAIAQAAVRVAIVVGISIAQRKLFGPKGPAQTNLQAEFVQTDGPLIERYGLCLAGGERVFWTFKEKTQVKVTVLASTELTEVVDVYLNGKTVTLNANGEVTDDKYVVVSTIHNTPPTPPTLVDLHQVKILTTPGTDDQTALSELTTLFPSDWTADHRARGHALCFGFYDNPGRKKFAAMYETGDVPTQQIAGKFGKCYDPRDGSTAFSENSALQLMQYLQSEHGGSNPLADFELAEWQQGANDCDDAIPKKAGGTEPRYRSALSFRHSEPRSEVINRFLATCGGTLREKPNGKIGFRAAKYRVPTITISEEHIIAIDGGDGSDGRQRFSELTSTYTSPDHDFTAQTAAPYQDPHLVAKYGVKKRPVDRKDVPSPSQAQRLDKWDLATQNPDRELTLVLRFIGLKLMDEESILLNLPDLGFVNEPMQITFWGSLNDFTEFKVKVQTYRDASAWDPATEEGDPPPSVAEVGGQNVVIPTPLGLSVSVASSVLGSTHVPTLVASWNVNDDFQPVAQFRAEGETEWTPMAVQSTRDSAVSPPVDEAQDYEVRVFFAVDATIADDPSDPATGSAASITGIQITADPTAPAAPTVDSNTFDAVSGALTVDFTPDVGVNLFKTVLLRSDDTNVANAVVVDTDFAAGGDQQVTNTASGTNTYWVRSENQSAVASAEVLVGTFITTG